MKYKINKNEKYIKIYSVEVKGKGKILETLILAFRYIKKVKGSVLGWNGNNLNDKQIIEIELLDEHPKDKVISKKFDCVDFNSHKFYNFTKVQGALPLSKIDFLVEFIFNKEIIKNKNKIVSISKTKFSQIYGVNGKGKIILPTEFEILDKENYDEDNEFKSFMKIFDKEIDNKTELNKIIKVLYDYLNNDIYNLTIFCFGMVSIFRLFLIETEKLQLFPYLILLSHSPNRGKSSSCKLLINGILLGFEYNFAESSSLTKGSIKRLAEKQFITAPLYIEELSSFGRNEDTFKELATQSVYESKLSLGNSNKNHSVIIRRGSFISSSNKLSKEIPDALRDRSLILNLENRIEYVGLIKDYDFLIKNGFKLSRFIWENLNDFKKNINLKSNKRENAKEEILSVGLQLVNSLFSKFEKKPLHLDINSIIVNEEDLISTENDVLKSKIYNEISFLTRNNYNDIYSIPNLFIRIKKLTDWINNYEKNYRIENGNLSGAYDGHVAIVKRNNLRNLETIYTTIITSSNKSGIKINDDGILLTKQFLKHIRIKYPNEFKIIKTIPNLISIFSKDDNVNYASSSNAGTIPTIKEIYGFPVPIKDKYEFGLVKGQFSGLFWKENKTKSNESISDSLEVNK